MPDHSQSTMVINYEQQELLPHLHEITPQERSQVEALVQTELSHQNTSRLHPQLDNLPIPTSLLNERYLEEDEEDDENDSKLDMLGIDMSRYTDTSISNLYTSMSYAVLQSRNDDLLTPSQYSATYSQHIQRLLDANTTVESSIGAKRKALEELNTQRKKLHENHDSLNGYLSEQWKESLKSVVDLGVERKRIEMNI